MRSSTLREDGPIQTTGVWLFGGISIGLALGKLIGLWGGSWWRMALPILIFVVFNALYIGIGFLYLTVAPVRERPEDEEQALLGRYTDRTYYGSGFLFVAGFVINLVSRLEGSEASWRWWLVSGRMTVLVVFGVFSVISLWLYWCGIGQVLGNEEDADL